ncbi:MAG: DNA mismatch repair endonuclease MutL [Anaerolineae bacterium]|nr:DNA mismatch repair endonuclease MutL [Anaerolineae bacterium]
MPIRLLPPEIANKIAAGEVVERPASVVKELVENALDAGATDIQIETRDGGRRLIRVADNGSGIPAREAELAFARHATSKIASVEDLAAIRTLGFRGEALASIAAVARVSLLTRAAEDEVGTFLRVEGGQVVQREGRASPRGTTVNVENLFYNVPARLKFLKADATESAHIANVVMRYAIAFPDVHFSLVRDGRLAFQSPGSGRLLDVLAKVFGADTVARLLPVDPAQDASLSPDAKVRVRGYVSEPSLTRSDRDGLMLFVNRRWVQDRSLAYAVIQAYHTMLPEGRFPVAVILLEMDPAEVDVNVHPAKSEVRFRNPSLVFSKTQRAVRRVLVAHAPVPEMHMPQPAQPQAHTERFRTLSQLGLEAQRTGDTEAVRAPVFQVPERPDPAARRLPPLRVLGQLAQMYIIAEGPDGLYLIDQHAAHERVMYDQLMAQQAAAQAAAQQLLQPLPVELTPLQMSTLEEALGDLAALGFEIEPFGEDTCLVRAVPAAIAGDDVATVLRDTLNELGQEPPPPVQGHRVTAVVACHGAVRAGKTLTVEEMRALVEQLERSEFPRTCPHGRPTVLHLSMGLLAREFGR